MNPTSTICNLSGTDDGADRVVPATELFTRLDLTDMQILALLEAAAAWMINAQRTG